MSGKKESFKQYIPDIGLSIEKNTENVPQDNKYYLIHKGKIIESFKTLKLAEVRFKEKVKEIGYKPKPVDKSAKSAAELNIETYLDSKDIFWAEGPRRGKSGGRGGRGGV